MLEALGLLILVIAILAILGGTLVTKVPPEPSTKKAWTVMEDLLPERVEGTVYELGAGWGGVALSLAKRYPENPIVAIELSPLPYLVSWLRARLSGASNLEVRFVNALDVSITDAGLITCYLFSDVMARLEPKFVDQLPTGATVISNTFALPSLRAEEIREAQDRHRSKIYRYVMGGG